MQVPGDGGRGRPRTARPLIIVLPLLGSIALSLGWSASSDILASNNGLGRCPRPHLCLGNCTPSRVYLGRCPPPHHGHCLGRRPPPRPDLAAVRRRALAWSLSDTATWHGSRPSPEHAPTLPLRPPAAGTRLRSVRVSGNDRDERTVQSIFLHDSVEGILVHANKF
jgi:hypothetical protein